MNPPLFDAEFEKLMGIAALNPSYVYQTSSSWLKRVVG